MIRLITLILMMLIGISFISCSNKTNNQFEKKLYRRWLGAISVHSVHPYITQGESIKKPAGTWQKLFTVTFLDTSFNLQHDCLYYLVPNNDNPGKIVVFFNRKNSSCESMIPAKEDLIRNKVYNFSYEIDLSSNTKNHLLLNIDGDKIALRFINFKSLKDRYSGVNVTSMDSLTTSKSKNKLGDGSLCYRVDDNCNITQSFRCNDCQNGWHEVVSSNCFTQYNKVCGRDKCGQRGHPACIRGRTTTGYDLNYCINDSPLAFCDKGLRVLCIANQLICR